MANPKAPAGLGARGSAFWRDITGTYDLLRHEQELLAECCRCLDQIDALQAAIAADGVTVRGSEGQPRTHPALDRINSTRALLGRLLGQLALPDEDDVEQTPQQRKASKAARTRWRAHNERQAEIKEFRRGSA